MGMAPGRQTTPSGDHTFRSVWVAQTVLDSLKKVEDMKLGREGAQIWVEWE